MPNEIVQTAYQALRSKFSQLYNDEKSLTRLDRAFEIAREAHKNQQRASGDPYILHPLAVADILLTLKLDPNSIITAVLHDVVEDSEMTTDMLAKEVGPEVAGLVDGVTKLTRIEYQPEHVKQAENFRKLLLAISDDIRVLIVKLADRLHNMRTLHYIKSSEKKMRIAHETMEIYSPLAERIGIYKFKNELQDLAFSFMHADIKASIMNRLSFLRQEGIPLVKKIEDEIRQNMKEEGIQCSVTGREKTVCSIWRKMEMKNVAFEQLADIMAFRIIVDSISDCYRVLGIIHSKYHMVPSEFKDYISTPKVNGYQSLHTIVMGPENRCIEIQIRTSEMHEVAELGVAAHWAYKQGHEYQKTQGVEFRWIRELLSILESSPSPEEFLENTKLEMYYDQVFCFTPKGDLIALPKSATVVDFAFAVHSNVGLRCVGAKVNARIVPLKTKLENGDQVEIMCAKEPMPSPAWEKFVITGKAKSAIRKFLRTKQREDFEVLGKAMLTKALQAVDQKYDAKNLSEIAEQFKKDSEEDLLVAIGEGSISSNEVIKALHPELVKKSKSRNPFAFLTFKRKKKEKNNSTPIKGLIPGMAIHFAGCCHPVPGDKIIGIIHTGKGISIHNIECESLESMTSQPERRVELSWDGSVEGEYVSRLKITLLNTTGSLADVTQCIAKNNANIANFKVLARSIDFFEIIVDCEVKGVQHLSGIMKSLRDLNTVYSVERSKSG